ncbi:hypothetical protein Misp04_40370 [Micromonospora sp. NBRC 101691]|nr:hypothetical protein Misp04_40370 [Micromonospora sp. NBRC 101691]
MVPLRVGGWHSYCNSRPSGRQNRWDPCGTRRSGLTFYSGIFATEVAHLPAPTGECAALPPTADSHVGWSGFADVVFYRTADCTGQATGMGTLRTYEAGGWQSFLAS